ncbi:conserved domain protein [Streptococcus parasanguinis SK236]|nr:conserved domain protein [Streptococcus parasanguinis SK236]
MISSFSLCSIRVAGLAYPATKKELVVYSTFSFYQDFIILSNTSISFKVNV